MVPLVKKLHEEDVPIVALGVESKALVRGLRGSGRVVTCSYPVDRYTSDEFISTMDYMMSEYIFQVDSV